MCCERGTCGEATTRALDTTFAGSSGLSRGTVAGWTGALRFTQPLHCGDRALTPAPDAAAVSNERPPRQAAQQRRTRRLSRPGQQGLLRRPLAADLPLQRDPRVPLHARLLPRHPKRLASTTTKLRAVFHFGSDEPRVAFLCQFDRKRYRDCGLRFTRWFRVGRHVLRVRARDAADNVDPTPAVYRFRVRQVSRRAFRRHRGA